MNIVSKGLVFATIAAGFAVAAQAVTVLPVSAVGSSSYSGYADVSAIDNNPLTDWASNGQGSGSQLTLDLGALYDLTTAFVTDRVTSGGSNGAFAGGTTDFTTSFTLQFFTDAGLTNQTFALGYGPVATPVNPQTPSDFLSVVDLSTVTARYVVYTALSTNGPNSGLSDIRFDGTLTAVPEPASWFLMVAGFGLVGVAARRRNAPVAA